MNLQLRLKLKLLNQLTYAFNCKIIYKTSCYIQKFFSFCFFTAYYPIYLLDINQTHTEFCYVCCRVVTSIPLYCVFKKVRRKTLGTEYYTVSTRGGLAESDGRRYQNPPPPGHRPRGGSGSPSLIIIFRWK